MSDETEDRYPNEPVGPSTSSNEEAGTASQETVSEIETLRRQVAAKGEEIQALQDKYLRACAELDNFKKMTAREREELLKYGQERFFKELLPVLDSLERAVFHAKEARNPDKILEGLELILKLMQEMLAKFGVTAFDSYLQPFDPAKHQALGQVESDEYDEGTVVEEVQRGYWLNDRVLRPALVMVSKKKEAEAEADQGPGTPDNPQGGE